MTTLHIGTFTPDEVIDLLPTADVIVFRDGDSWEEWGEPLTAFDNHPEHLIIRTKWDNHGAVELLRDVAWMLECAASLVPMGYTRQAGTIAAITPDSDWSEPHYLVVDVQAKRFIERLDLSDDYDQVWSNPQWQDFNEGERQ